MAISLACITVLLGYNVNRLERSSDQMLELLERPATGTIIFRNTASFLQALTEATVGAVSVSTINSAVGRGSLPELDKYFRLTNRYWASKEAAKGSFRSVAYVENAAKALWLVESL